MRLLRLGSIDRVGQNSPMFKLLKCKNKIHNTLTVFFSVIQYIVYAKEGYHILCVYDRGYQ